MSASPRSPSPMEEEPLDALVERVREHPSVQDKRSIHRAYDEPLGETVSFEHPFFPEATAGDVKIGDDCAALPDGHGDHLLFASEGIVPAFVQAHPWFAGYSAVMVNLSDICAMGGRPLAVTDMLWVKDRADGQDVWSGMTAAADAYGVPVVGGHTSYRCDDKHLGVAVLGQAGPLLTSYEAQPGEVLLMAVDLNGAYFGDDPFWNTSTDATPERLRALLPLMHEVAAQGWSRAAKDISMGGVVGTLAMLLHTSAVGATLRLDDVPRPPGVPWSKWLVSFPSFGFLLTASPGDARPIRAHFHAHDVACEAVGRILPEKEGLRVTRQGEQAQVL